MRATGLDGHDTGHDRERCVWKHVSWRIGHVTARPAGERHDIVVNPEAFVQRGLARDAFDKGVAHQRLPAVAAAGPRHGDSEQRDQRGDREGLAAAHAIMHVQRGAE